MNTTEKAMAEMRSIKNDACSGLLSEQKCIKRLEDFKKQYGNDYFMSNHLGDIKQMPSTKEKMETLRNVYAQGGASEETFIEMARTGYAIRKKRIVKYITIIGSIVIVIAIIIGIIVSIVKR